LLDKHFDVGELRTLCFGLGVEYDNLPGAGKANRAMELVAYCERRNRVRDLVLTVRRERPTAAWQGLRLAEFRHVFISYKRDLEPDQPLALSLVGSLSEAGHVVHIDRGIKVGMDWAAEIKRLIAESDYMIVLLSSASVNSEMVVREVGYARDMQVRLLPVRVGYAEELPYPLGLYLDPVQYAEWHETADTAGVTQRLLDAIEDVRAWQAHVGHPSPFRQRQESGFPQPVPHADPRSIHIPIPGGAIELESRFYVKRDADEKLRKEIVASPSITATIRGSRQTGKTSLLIRAAAQAQRAGYRVVYLDLQQVDSSLLQDQGTFLRYLTEFIADQLSVDPAQAKEAWQGSLASSNKIERFLEDSILSRGRTRVMLVMDEVERLLQTSFHDDFFGLLRAWYNYRARDPRWHGLSVVLVISTEPYLLIRDRYRSPFNVGLRLKLEDFDEAQVGDLNERYGSPVRHQDLEGFMDLLGGHPYLTQQALYTLVTRELSWSDLVDIAASDGGPFRHHLRHYLWLLQGQRDMVRAMREIVRRGRCRDERLFNRLLRAGLVKRAARPRSSAWWRRVVDRLIAPSGQVRGDGRSCACRCRLYEAYLGEKL
jgi:hypothetical protein